MYKLISAIALTLLVSGCATANVTPSRKSSVISSEHVTERSYNLNQTSTAFVGGTMLRVRDYRIDRYTTEEIEIRNDVSMRYTSIGASDAVIPAGSRYPYGGRAVVDGQEVSYFEWTDSFNGWLVPYDENGQILDTLIVPFGGLTDSYWRNDSTPGTVQEVVREDIHQTGEGRNFELIYSGVDRDTLRLNYREFTNPASDRDGGLARQAFFQELTYPANTGRIRFRDMVIEIQSANAESITFVVVEHDESSD